MRNHTALARALKVQPIYSRELYKFALTSRNLTDRQRAYLLMTIGGAL